MLIAASLYLLFIHIHHIQLLIVLLMSNIKTLLSPTRLSSFKMDSKDNLFSLLAIVGLLTYCVESSQTNSQSSIQTLIHCFQLFRESMYIREQPIG